MDWDDVWLITHPEFRRDPKVRATATFLKETASHHLSSLRIVP